ncbi:MAG: glutaminase [Pseudomonadota bacterium]
MTEPDGIEARLDEIERRCRPLSVEGRVADYIPALGRVPPSKFGMAIAYADGREAWIGDAEEPFSIQSISKVFSLAHALEAIGEDLWRRVGREPSGMAFNSMALLEHEDGIPRNPLINAGAIVVADALLEIRPDWTEAQLDWLGRLAESGGAAFDEEVFASEERHGDLNRSIAWYLKAKDNLRTSPEAATRAYFRACSAAMSCRELARAARFLVRPGCGPAAEHFARPGLRRRIRAIMRTCGLYDAAGDFAYRVGLPAKSGVGGGILAIEPGKFAVAVWSPALDAKGNSLAGQAALEMLVGEAG